MREQNLTISPNEAIQSLGTASQPISGPSLDHRDLGMGGQQRLREHVVEREHPERRDHHRLVDGPTDALRPARRRHALVTADDRDDRAEHGAFEDRPPEVRDRGVGEEGRPERAERGAVDERREDAAEDAEQQRVDVEQTGDEHQREEARDHEVLDRVDAEHLERVELLADLARAEVGGDRGAGHAGEHDRGHERGELADRGEHEEAAEAVERAEQHEEVRGLQAGGAVAEGDRRDDEREPAQLQREEELRHELAAVRIRGAQGGHDRLPRQDHHVAHFFKQALGWQERSVGDASDHQSPQVAAAKPTRSVMQAPNARRRRNWRSICPMRVLSQPMGYIRARMRSRSAMLVVTTVLVAGCGSGPRQDADEPSGSYKLEVAAAKFPASQSIAQDSRMIVTVRNDDTKAAPNVAVTVETDPSKAG